MDQCSSKQPHPKVHLGVNRHEPRRPRDHCSRSQDRRKGWDDMMSSPANRHGLAGEMVERSTIQQEDPHGKFCNADVPRQCDCLAGGPNREGKRLDFGWDVRASNMRMVCTRAWLVVGDGTCASYPKLSPSNNMYCSC